MLETLIFREIRYNENNEQLLKENLNKIKENPDDVEVLKTLASIYHALKENDNEKAFSVIDLHNKLYRKEKEVRKAHIKRVSKQECDVKAGLYYIDVISHFTRVGDHGRNLVEKMIETKVSK